MANNWVADEWGTELDTDFGGTPSVDGIKLSSTQDTGSSTVPGLITPELSSLNFDGSIPRVRATISDVANVLIGTQIYLDSNETPYTTAPVGGWTETEMSYTIVSKSTSGSNIILGVIKDENIITITVATGTQVFVVQEDWTNKTLGSNGWAITSGGNAIFTNIAARGTIQAESGYLKGMAINGVLDIQGTGTDETSLNVGAVWVRNDPLTSVTQQPSIVMNNVNGLVIRSAEIAPSGGKKVVLRAPINGDPVVIGGWQVTSAGISAPVDATTITAGDVNNNITIQGGALPNSIYTTIAGVPTVFGDTSPGFRMAVYSPTAGTYKARLKLQGTNGSLLFDGDNLIVTGAVNADSGNFAGAMTVNGGTMKIGTAAGGTGNHGIYIGSGNYWYDTGNFSLGGANGITYNGSTVTIGSGVTINADVTVGGLVVGTTNKLYIDDLVSDVNNLRTGTLVNAGIYMNANNYWYTTGILSVGSSTKNMVWDGTNLTVNGSVINTPTISTPGITNGSITGTSINVGPDKFTVDSAGNMVATSATVTGTIKATDGYIGGSTSGWDINSGYIISSGGTAKITLDAVNAKIYIGTGTYGNANTPFYADGASQFSLGDKLTFTGGNLSITGVVTATSGSFTGSITAGSGSIGGFTIDTGKLYAGTANQSNWLGFIPGSATVAIFAGATDNAGAGAKFKVGNDGTLVATGANISGAITATSGSFTGTVTANDGTIGGFTIVSNRLYASSGTSPNIKYAGIYPDTLPFFAGATNNLGAGAVFSVSPTGAVTASNVSVTGGPSGGNVINIGPNKFIVDSLGNMTATTASITGGPSGGNVLDVGGKFTVTSTGVLTATGATITGNITATDGTFTGIVNANSGRLGNSTSGWQINSTDITSYGTTGKKVVLKGSGAIYISANASPAYNQADTPFYVDGNSQFSLGQKLLFDSSTATPTLTVNGTINASGGNFTGYVLAGAARFGKEVQTGKNGIWLNANNYWYDDGTIKAVTGTIGGWSLADSIIYGGSGTGNIAGMTSGTSNYSFFAGANDSSGASSKFSVTNQGAVTASNINITGGPSGGNVINVGSGVFTVSSLGAVTATSGNIAGWTINSNTISNSNVTLYAGSTSAQRTNLVPNPSFETGVANTGANLASSNVASTAEYIVGTQSALVTSNSTLAAFGIYPTNGSNRLAVTAGSTYTFSGYIKDVDTSVQYAANIEWYDALTGGTRISTSLGTATTITSTGWTRVSITATAPTGSIAATPTLYSTQQMSGTGKKAYFDALLFEQTNILKDYFDGSFPNSSWSGTAHASTSTVYDTAISAGGTFRLNSPFQVKYDGSVYATNAFITGQIKATSGYIGGSTSGWAIGSELINSSYSTVVTKAGVTGSNGGYTITVPDNTGLYVSMKVSGTNIASGAYITAINGTLITLSAANTNAVNTTVTFTPNKIYLQNSTAPKITISNDTTGYGAHGSATTPFYVDAAGRMSLLDKLIFDPSDSQSFGTLTVIGRIRGAIENTPIVPTDSNTFYVGDVVVAGSSPTQTATITTLNTSGAATTHAFAVGDTVILYGIAGTAAVLNGAWVVSAKTTNTFTITSSTDAPFGTISSTTYGAATTSVSTTADTTNTKNTITVASATGISVGQYIEGTGITSGTTVQFISGTTITMSANATATGTGVTVKFYGSSRIREMTLGLHAAKNGSPAGLGLRIDENNYWFLNNQFKVGTSGSYMKWDGSTLETSGKIVAQSGDFAGAMTVAGGTMKIGKAADGTNDGFYVGQSGDYWLSSGNFRFGGASGISYSGGNVSIGTGVDIAGNLTSPTGKIGGWTIQSNYLKINKTGTSFINPASYVALAAPARLKRYNRVFNSSFEITIPNKTTGITATDYWTGTNTGTLVTAFDAPSAGNPYGGNSYSSKGIQSLKITGRTGTVKIKSNYSGFPVGTLTPKLETGINYFAGAHIKTSRASIAFDINVYAGTSSTSANSTSYTSTTSWDYYVNKTNLYTAQLADNGLEGFIEIVFNNVQSTDIIYIDGVILAEYGIEFSDSSYFDGTSSGPISFYGSNSEYPFAVRDESVFFSKSGASAEDRHRGDIGSNITTDSSILINSTISGNFIGNADLFSLKLYEYLGMSAGIVKPTLKATTTYTGTVELGQPASSDITTRPIYIKCLAGGTGTIPSTAGYYVYIDDYFVGYTDNGSTSDTIVISPRLSGTVNWAANSTVKIYSYSQLTVSGANSGEYSLFAGGNITSIGNLSSAAFKVNELGNITTTGTLIHSYTRTLPTTVNDVVYIGSTVTTNGAATYEISIVVDSSNFSVSKQYLIPVNYNETNGAWQIVNPVADGGPYSSNDFDLDIIVSNNSTSFRIRRTAGSTAGTAYITFKANGNTPAFTPSTTTGSVSAPTTYYNAAILSQEDGAVAVKGSLNITGNITNTGTLQIGNSPFGQYRTRLGGGTDLAWKKLATITLNTGLYVGFSATVDVIEVGGNWGNLATSTKSTYFVSAQRSATVQDDAVTMSLSGPNADRYIRGVKVDNATYEIQGRSPSNYNHIIFEGYGISSNGNVSIVWEAGTNAGSSGTIYTPTATNINWFSKISTYGTITTDGQIISNVTTGTAPFTVASTTKVTNLNADLFDDIDSTKFVYGQNASATTNAAVTQTLTNIEHYKAGFWDVTGASWTPDTNWYWGMTLAHRSNSSSYLYGAQLVVKNGGPGDVYVRTLDGGATPAAGSWYKMWNQANDAPIVMTRATVINTVTTDINTITAAGTYQVSGASWGAGLNGPTSAYTYGQFVVTTNGNIVTQTFYPHSTGGAWTRTKFNASDWRAWQKLWTDQNDGSGTGLDADLLDGYDSSIANANSTVVVRSAAGDIASTSLSANYLVLPAQGSGGYITGGEIRNSILDLHPEGNTTVLPYISNDIAYVTQRGGTVTVNYGSVPTLAFDGSPAYATWTPSDLTTNVPTGFTIEIAFHKTFAYGTKVGVNFGNVAWRAKTIQLEIYRDDTASWYTASSVTNYAYATFTANVSTSGYTISKMRWTFNDYAGAGSGAFRIAQIWLLNYNSSLSKEIFLGRDGGDMYGSIQPYTTNTNSLGTASKRWQSVYSTNLVAIDTANPLHQWYNTGAGTDQKWWRAITSTAGTFAFQTVNDAYNAATDRLTISNAGAVTIPGTLSITGATTATGRLTSNGGITLASANEMLINDTTGTEGRIIASGGTFYIQAGSNSSDTGAILTITRNSSSANISQFNINSDAINANGRLTITTTDDNPLKLVVTDASWNYMTFFNSAGGTETRKAYFGLNSAQDTLVLGLESTVTKFSVLGQLSASGAFTANSTSGNIIVNPSIKDSSNLERLRITAGGTVQFVSDSNGNSLQIGATSGSVIITAQNTSSTPLYVNGASGHTTDLVSINNGTTTTFAMGPTGVSGGGNFFKKLTGTNQSTGVSTETVYPVFGTLTLPAGSYSFMMKTVVTVKHSARIYAPAFTLKGSGGATITEIHWIADTHRLLGTTEPTVLNNAVNISGTNTFKLVSDSETAQELTDNIAVADTWAKLIVTIFGSFTTNDGTIIPGFRMEDKTGPNVTASMGTGAASEVTYGAGSFIEFHKLSAISGSPTASFGPWS